MIVVFAVAVLCVVIDQLTKYWATARFVVTNGNVLAEGITSRIINGTEITYKTESVPVIDGVFQFRFIPNEGAAFGSLSDHRWIFMIVSVLLIVAIIGYTVWKRPKNLLLCLSLGLLAGGGIGNMIDRVALGYVVDFLDFCAFPDLWKWIFNFADVFVCVGTAAMVLWMLKYDGKPEKPSKKAAAEIAADDAKGGNEDDEAE